MRGIFCAFIITLGSFMTLEGGRYEVWGKIFMVAGSIMLGYFLGYITAEATFLRRQNERLEESLKLRSNRDQ